MKCEQVEIFFNEICKALTTHARNARIFAAPEIAMMNDQRIGATGVGGAKQIQRRGDSGYNRANLGPPFHL